MSRDLIQPPRSFAAFIARRVARAMVLIFVVASTAMLLVHLAPGDALSVIGGDPEYLAAERARLGLDRPFVAQYADWLRRLATFDFGESVQYQRPVSELLAERVGNTLLLGIAALAIALGLGLPAGVITGRTPGGVLSRGIEAASLLLLSAPPLVTALLFLLLAFTTGWFPTGGFEWTGSAPSDLAAAVFRYVPLPAVALGLPIAAVLERLQSQAIGEALDQPCVAAARARGLPMSRVTWIHAWRLSMKSILGVLGIVIGSVLSGSFIVEYVMSWPGLGTLMHAALMGHDLHLAAGCAAVGAALLSVGLVITDVALAAADPRVVDGAGRG